VLRRPLLLSGNVVLLVCNNGVRAFRQDVFCYGHFSSLLLFKHKTLADIINLRLAFRFRCRVRNSVSNFLRVIIGTRRVWIRNNGRCNRRTNEHGRIEKTAEGIRNQGSADVRSPDEINSRHELLELLACVLCWFHLVECAVVVLRRVRYSQLRRVAAIRILHFADGNVSTM